MSPPATAHPVCREPQPDVAPVRSRLARYRGNATGTPDRMSPPIAVGSGAGLVDILSMAVEINRNVAMRHSVRIHCYVLDQVLDSDAQGVLLDKLDLLLGRVVRTAHWGSLVTCQAGICDGEVRIYIRFAVPAPAEAACESEIDWVDEVWSWSLDEPAAHVH